VAALVSAEVFLTLTERSLTAPEAAAGRTFQALFVLQAAILLWWGSGSVAGGLAEEREAGLLDYHRLTPMGPTAKILGYLFGLPAREYILVGTTLPFTVASVIIGRIGLSSVLELYVVLLTSAWLYHMTGLVVGMVASRPRRASWATRLALLGLYIFLPQLGSLGLTFLGHLTVLPAFDGLATMELGAREMGKPLLWHDAGFFAARIPPFAYTLLVQGLLLVALFSVVRRKWLDQGLHPFSKRGALLFFPALLTLMVGSLWPFLTGDQQLRLWRHLQLPAEGQWLQTLYLFFAVAGAAAFILLAAITPTWQAYLRGLRRARRQGRARDRIPWGADEAPGLVAASAMLGMATAGYFLLLGLALPDEGLRWSPGAITHLGLLLLFAGLLLQIQTVCALFGAKGLGVLAGLCWFLPASIALILASAFGAFVPAGYLAAATPFAAFLYALVCLFEPALAEEPNLAPLLGHARGMLAFALLLSLGLPLLGQAWLWRRRREAKRRLAPPVAPDSN
jgi:hypothetical protein